MYHYAINTNEHFNFYINFWIFSKQIRPIRSFLDTCDRFLDLNLLNTNFGKVKKCYLLNLYKVQAHHMCLKFDRIGLKMSSRRLERTLFEFLLNSN